MKYLAGMITAYIISFAITFTNLPEPAAIAVVLVLIFIAGMICGFAMNDKESFINKGFKHGK